MTGLSELQIRILKKEYPHLSLTSDVDIERYFEFRTLGRQQDALAIYRTRLVKKYPDPQKRSQLIRYYRSKNPRFQILLSESLATLANSIIEKTKKIILLFSKNIDSLNYNDAYSVIKHAENLISIISPDRFKAIEIIEKYASLARELDFYSLQMEKTSELIRLYVTDSLVVLHDFREQRKQTALQEKKQKKIETAPSIDLTKINFSEFDIQRICISEKITKTEDIVLAYCLKYWNLYNDISFERTILLYSRKNKTKHYDFFKVIQNGRQHAWKDEEILNAVLSSVVSGYYYSISGDLYLQRMWARYKHAQEMEVKKPEKSPEIFVAKAAPKAPAKSKPAKTKPAPTMPASSKAAPKAPAKSNPAKTKPAPKMPASAIAANSIADIIRRKTNKTYTVYKELFFQRIRPSIRHTLVKNSTKKVLPFSNKQNEAEELIYSFLQKNYTNPYQNWALSQEKKHLDALGYTIDSIEIIIEHWIAHTS